MFWDDGIKILEEVISLTMEIEDVVETFSTCE